MRPSLGWQGSFLASFVRGNVAAAPPFALLVDATRRCNLNCLHCRAHSPAAAGAAAPRPDVDFPIERYRTLCEEAGRMGVRRLVLIGEGEPMLHPDIVEMIASAAAAGLEVIMLTNGTLLEARHARELGGAGLAELRVSLWAADEAQYAALYPGSSPRLFRRAVEGVRAFAEARRVTGARRPRIVLHRPIERRFYRGVAGTLDLAVEAGCDEISLSPLKPLLDGDVDRLLSREEVRELLPLLREVGRRATAAGLGHNVKDVLARYRLGRDAWQALPCYIGWIDVRVRVDGDVVPCDTCRWVLGNLMHSSLQDVWNGPGYREFRAVARRPERIRASGRDCRCDYCCHVLANRRIHRYVRWFAPLAVRHREISA